MSQNPDTPSALARSGPAAFHPGSVGPKLQALCGPGVFFHFPRQRLYNKEAG
jgi:hypothetical protein